MAETILTLGPIQFPAGADWGIRETLSWVDNGEIVRTVNGKLVDYSRKTARKLEATISCSNALTAPALEGIWRGSQITVGCVTRRHVSASGSATVTLDRPPVEGSVRAVDAAGNELAVVSSVAAGNGVRLTLAGVPAGTVSYRPQLLMLVTAISIDVDEAGATTSWTLQLGEV